MCKTTLALQNLPTSYSNLDPKKLVRQHTTKRLKLALVRMVHYHMHSEAGFIMGSTNGPLRAFNHEPFARGNKWGKKAKRKDEYIWTQNGLLYTCHLVNKNQDSVIPSCKWSPRVIPCKTLKEIPERKPWKKISERELCKRTLEKDNNSNAKSVHHNLQFYKIPNLLGFRTK